MRRPGRPALSPFKWCIHCCAGGSRRRFFFPQFAAGWIIPFPDNNRHISQTVGPRCCAAIIPGGAGTPKAFGAGRPPYPLHRLSLGTVMTLKPDVLRQTHTIGCSGRLNQPATCRVQPLAFNFCTRPVACSPTRYSFERSRCERTNRLDAIKSCRRTGLGETGHRGWNRRRAKRVPSRCPSKLVNSGWAFFECIVTRGHTVSR